MKITPAKSLNDSSNAGWMKIVAQALPALPNTEVRDLADLLFHKHGDDAEFAAIARADACFRIGDCRTASQWLAVFRVLSADYLRRGLEECPLAGRAAAVRPQQII